MNMNDFAKVFKNLDIDLKIILKKLEISSINFDIFAT